MAVEQHSNGRPCAPETPDAPDARERTERLARWAETMQRPLGRESGAPGFLSENRGGAGFVDTIHALRCYGRFLRHACMREPDGYSPDDEYGRHLAFEVLDDALLALRDRATDALGGPHA